MNPTNGVLVVIADDETSAHALETAIRQAEEASGHLVAIHVMSPSTYESKQHGISSVDSLRRDGFAFTIDQARESACLVADAVVKEAIGSRDVPFVALGEVGRTVPVLIATAAAHDCGTVVLTEQRSWWRKMIDLTARRMATQFEGDVITGPGTVVDIRETLLRPAARK